MTSLTGQPLQASAGGICIQVLLLVGYWRSHSSPVEMMGYPGRSEQPHALQSFSPWLPRGSVLGSGGELSILWMQ